MGALPSTHAYGRVQAEEPLEGERGQEGGLPAKVVGMEESVMEEEEEWLDAGPAETRLVLSGENLDYEACWWHTVGAVYRAWPLSRATSFAVFVGLFWLASAGLRPSGALRAPVVPSGFQEAWDYRRNASDLPPVKVCVRMFHRSCPQASMFLRDGLRRWGSELTFEISQPIRDSMTEFYRVNQISKDDIDPPVFGEECDPDWPELWLFRVQDFNAERNSKTEYKGLKIITGDEFCRCNGHTSCSADFEVGLRHYFSAHLSPFVSWLPLGPRFEWTPVQSHEVRPASERTVPWTFQGALTNPVRTYLSTLLQKKSMVRKYPALARGVLQTSYRWGKFVVKREEYASPKEYRDTVLNSVFTLCPTGNNPESFRIYEAVEAGSIPVISLDSSYWESHCHDAFKPFLDTNAPFLFINDWAEFPAKLEAMLADPLALNQRQLALAEWRASFWSNTSRTVDCTIMQHHARTTGAPVDLARFCDDRPLPLFDTDARSGAETNSAAYEIAAAQMDGGTPLKPRPRFVPSRASWAHPVWGFSGPSDKPLLQVCVTSHEKSKGTSAVSSIFTQDYLQRWGSRLQFISSKKGCTSSRAWPQMWLSDDPGTFFGDELTVRRTGPQLLLRDALCTCKEGRPEARCSGGDEFSFRQYFSSDMLESKWFPLGPGTHWLAVDPSEIQPASERSHSFVLVTDPSKPTSKSLAQTLKSLRSTESFAALETGLVILKKAQIKTAKGFQEARAGMLGAAFTICPRSKAIETHCIYEAIDSGSIPVLARAEADVAGSACTDPLEPFLRSGAPFLFVDSWSDFPPALEALVADKPALDRMQRNLASWRRTFWEGVVARLECAVLAAHERHHGSTSDLPPAACAAAGFAFEQETP